MFSIQFNLCLHYVDVSLLVSHILTASTSFSCSSHLMMMENPSHLDHTIPYHTIPPPHVDPSLHTPMWRPDLTLRIISSTAYAAQSGAAQHTHPYGGCQQTVSQFSLRTRLVSAAVTIRVRGVRIVNCTTHTLKTS